MLNLWDYAILGNTTSANWFVLARRSKFSRGVFPPQREGLVVVSMVVLRAQSTAAEEHSKKKTKPKQNRKIFVTKKGND